DLAVEPRHLPQLGGDGDPPLAAILGPILGGFFGDVAKSSQRLEAWLVPFLVAAAGCLLGTVLAAILSPPEPGPSAKPSLASTEPDAQKEPATQH
ncbi:MAG: hypothetical protein H5U01_10600, partial [Clostridia bacterium]|nr:hypothetical protein [Clostridia bacterium]